MADPNLTFEDLKLSRQFLNALEDLGHSIPTPVQAKCIPLALAGHDVMGIAQTGTGKTAAFVLPILMKLKYAQGQWPKAVIFAPTRELVMQIRDQVKVLSAYTDLRFTALYGGIGPKDQIAAVEQGIDIIISTPGRFLDLYKRGVLITKEIKTMVLDEADKMMDMGFMPQIRNILEVIPVKRQNLLFSATMPEKVVKLSEEFLEFPEVAEVAPQATTAPTIEQMLFQAPNFKTKINLLEFLLQDPALERVIIFVKTKTNANNVSKFLERKGLGSVRVIHANKGQNSRINAIQEFREGNVRLLVSTDVTARGMDISMVSHVINFDVPLVYEDYVHRIGRTGRAHHSGIAITFANELEMYHICKIEQLIRQDIPISPLPGGVVIEKTPFEEKQMMARELDAIRKRENPDYKGAFHEKKKRPATVSNKKKGGRRRK